VSERRTAATITDAELTALYDRLAQAGRTVAGLQAANQRLRNMLAKFEQEGAVR
jgi:recombinational DNA repair protein (RecF pathway)